jgi:hypothetical protein
MPVEYLAPAIEDRALEVQQLLAGKESIEPRRSVTC